MANLPVTPCGIFTHTTYPSSPATTSRPHLCSSCLPLCRVPTSHSLLTSSHYMWRFLVTRPHLHSLLPPHLSKGSLHPSNWDFSLPSPAVCPCRQIGFTSPINELTNTEDSFRLLWQLISCYCISVNTSYLKHIMLPGFSMFKVIFSYFIWYPNRVLISRARRIRIFWGRCR